jgi:hypothetical protein
VADATKGQLKKHQAKIDATGIQETSKTRKLAGCSLQALIHYSYLSSTVQMKSMDSMLFMAFPEER